MFYPGDFLRYVGQKPLEKNQRVVVTGSSGEGFPRLFSGWIVRRAPAVQMRDIGKVKTDQEQKDPDQHDPKRIRPEERKESHRKENQSLAEDQYSAEN